MSTQHSGTLIRDLCDHADRAIQSSQPSPTDAVLRGILDPGMYLADVKKYLSVNAAIDSGDEAAWWAVHSVQACHFSQLTDECFFCGQMEGQHAEWTSQCPDDGGTVFRLICTDYGPELDAMRRKVS
jgi:hypothetical protein